MFETTVGDSRSHTQAADRGRGQAAVIVTTVTAIVQVQGITAIVAEHSQVAVNTVERAGGGTDIDHVVTIACINGGIGIGGPDIDDIRTAKGIYRGFATAADITHIDDIVVIAAGDGHLVCIDGSEQIDVSTAIIDIIDIAADDHVTGSVDLGATGEGEIIARDELDITTGGRADAYAGLDQQIFRSAIWCRGNGCVCRIIGQTQRFNAGIESQIQVVHQHRLWMQVDVITG